MLQIVSVTVMYKLYEINFVVYSNIFEKNVFKLKRKWLVYVYWVYSFVSF